MDRDALRAALGSQQFWDRVFTAAPQASTKKPPRAPQMRTAAPPDPLLITDIRSAPVIRPQPGQGCDYQMIGSIAELREYLRPAWQDRVPFGADTETSHLNPALARPVGFGVSTGPKSGRYAPVGHALSTCNLPLIEVLRVLQECDAAGAPSIWYNAGYDHEVLLNSCQWEPVHWHDAQIAIYLHNSNAIELNLKATALRLLGVKMQTIEELDEEWITLSKKAKKERGPKLPHQLPAERVAPYGCADPDCTRQLWFHKGVQESIALQGSVFQLEERLVKVMREGNRHGVYQDLPRLRELQAEAKEALTRLLPEIFAAMECEPFPLSKRAALGQKLFEIKAVGYLDKDERSPTYGTWTVERTSSGQVTTNKKILDKYRRQHAVIPKLIQYNELEAQERNYLRKLIRAGEHFATQEWAQGRVRFAFNSIGVPTGRMKCGGAGKGGEAFYKGVVDVNGQSAPEHEKAPYLPNTRSGMIVAPPGFVLVAADYSQIELRVAANESREPKWIEAYLQGKDLHVVTAQVITNVREPGVIVTEDDKRRRGHAKTTNFALLYGGDEHTVARNAGVPLVEAKQILDAYFQGLSVLKGWIDRTQNNARNQRMVRTFLGRIRHLEQYFIPEPSRRDVRRWKEWKKLDNRGCREAINDPIQGGAADIFKVACVRLQDAIARQGWGYDIISPQIFWVHDEVLFYVRQEWVTRVVPVLRAAMEFEIRGWPVPIKAEFEVGSRHLYAEAKQKKALKEGDAAEAAKWAALRDRAESSNWGELVPLKDWVARYAPEDVAA